MKLILYKNTQKTMIKIKENSIIYLFRSINYYDDEMIVHALETKMKLEKNLENVIDENTLI